MYIIRHQGFFYTDEYYAPGKRSTQILKKTFATKATAELACAELTRAWVRDEPLDNYLFDDRAACDRVLAYLQEQFPDEDLNWDRNLMIPDEATDEQVDEIVRRMRITFAQVHEIGVMKRLWTSPSDSDDDARDDPMFKDDLHYGPRWKPHADDTDFNEDEDDEDDEGERDEVDKDDDEEKNGKGL